MNKNERVKSINEYKKRKRNRHRKRKIKKILKPILLSLSILVIMITHLCGNAIVSEYKYEINNLKKELRKEEIELDILKMESLKYSSITNIEEDAREELGMNYPEESQIRYLDIND